ncbi:hypothetical protein D3C72_1374540 [compost metagenome]
MDELLRLGQVHSPYREIKRAIAKLWHRDSQQALEELEPGVRHLLLEAAGDFAKQGHAQPGRDTHRQGPLPLSGKDVHFLTGARQHTHSKTRMFQQDLPRLGQGDARRFTNDQGHPDFVFQLTDRFGDGGR